VYPKGDVDYYRVTLQEVTVEIFPNICKCPSPLLGCKPSPQCLYLDVEIVQPPGATFEATVLDGSCSKPTVSLTTTGKMTVHFDGTCGITDTRDVWIKVAPKAGSTPSWSCKPYQLKLKHYKVNNTECTP
jgi:hypothetical protein